MAIGPSNAPNKNKKKRKLLAQTKAVVLYSIFVKEGKTLIVPSHVGNIIIPIFLFFFLPFIFDKENYLRLGQSKEKESADKEFLQFNNLGIDQFYPSAFLSRLLLIIPQIQLVFWYDLLPGTTFIKRFWSSS